MSKPFSKEQSTHHAPREEKPKKERKPIAKMSEKKKAELEDRKNWTVEQFLKAQKEGKKEKNKQRKQVSVFQDPNVSKSTPLTKIKKEFDQIYSLVVKMEPANSQGIIKCYCGVLVHWSNANNSHFIPRSIAPSIIHDRMNTHPSCIPCNGFEEGNRPAYIPWMNSKYGTEQVELLRLRGQKKSNNGVFEYQIMLQEYIELFLIQCKRLNHTPTKAQQKIVDKWK